MIILMICKINYMDNLLQYQLHSLERICEEALISQLDMDSSVTMLVLADSCDANKLKSKCIDYIRKYDH